MKLPLPVDAHQLLNDYREFSPDIWSETSPTLQQAMQCAPNDPNPLLASCGALTPGMDEQAFHQTVDHLRGTYTEQLLSQLPFKAFRTRYMRLLPKSCYSIHADMTWRFHIPLETNPNAVLLFFDRPEFHRLEVGFVYMVNTTRLHTYMNGGIDDRIHIIGSAPDFKF